jgi:hypothetical protein
LRGRVLASPQNCYAEPANAGFTEFSNADNQSCWQSDNHGKKTGKIGVRVWYNVYNPYKYKKSLFRVAAKKRLFVMYRGVIRSGV